MSNQMNQPYLAPAASPAVGGTSLRGILGVVAAVTVALGMGCVAGGLALAGGEFHRSEPSTVRQSIAIPAAHPASALRFANPSPEAAKAPVVQRTAWSGVTSPEELPRPALMSKRCF